MNSDSRQSSFSSLNLVLINPSWALAKSKPEKTIISITSAPSTSSKSLDSESLTYSINNNSNFIQVDPATPSGEANIFCSLRKSVQYAPECENNKE